MFACRMQCCQHNMNMATASLRERTRSARTFSRNRSENEEDHVHLDANKDATENAFEILSNICKKQGLTDNKKIAYLNLFVKLMEDVRNGQLPLAISKKDIVCCLRVGLVSSNTVVRASTLRVLRHLLIEPSDVAILNKLQIPHLIARSVDIVVRNDHERIQALRLALRMVNLEPKIFPIAITRCLVSLVDSINESRDRMLYSALFLLCQLCMLNPNAAIDCMGETCILRCCIETAQGRINECLVGCLLFLLNKPETRNKAALKMEYLASVYCDLQRKPGNPAGCASSHLSIMAALRTWTGVFYLCNPTNSGGMKAIINVLTLNDSGLKRAVIELFYDILGLDCDDWSNDFEKALNRADPNGYRDSWKPHKGFIVAEGKDILPHFADTRPNLTEVHTALLVYTFLECGLVPALVEVAINSDSFLSVQSIVLLGYLLHVSHKLLPSELLDLSPSLPSLLYYVTNGDPMQRTRAVSVMSSLNIAQKKFSQRPAPNSLVLWHQMRQGSSHKKKQPDPGGGKIPSNIKVDKTAVKNLELHLKSSEMFSQNDPVYWDWLEISAILKCRSEAFLRFDDFQNKLILRRLVHYYKPSSSQFLSLETPLTDNSSVLPSTTALDLLDFLLEYSYEPECEKLLDDLLLDICHEIDSAIVAENIHVLPFSPIRLCLNRNQHYFVMIGHLTETTKGLAFLERCKALDLFFRMVDTCIHEIYTKVILSSLCYAQSSMARKILARALTCDKEEIRAYATELLLVLARCRVPLFHKWGLELLIPQIYDKNKVVANLSVDILHELSYDPVFLDCLVEIRPTLLHLGDKGKLLLIRFLSTSAGFTFLNVSNFVEKELDKWENGYNYRYVGLVESTLHDALTLHQRDDSGKYSKRLTNAKHRWKPVWVPPHLYGQLASHTKGFALIENNPCIQRMTQKLQTANCDSDGEILELKASLWALANIATSSLGVRFLEERQLLQAFVNVAQYCPVFSLRATAFYCLSLIATTEAGASSLAQLDWFAVRRKRNSLWPVEMEERPGQISSESEANSTLAFSLGDSESLEDISFFLEPVSTTPSSIQRASTLPPGLTGDFDETDLGKSPTTSKGRHQRSHSETCSLLLKQTEEPSTPQRMSFQDAAGLATLQSLQASKRPELSSNPLFSDSQQPRRFSEHRSSSPMTEFEAANPPRLFSNPSSASLSIADGQGDGLQEIGSPIYRGICLPRALTQFLSIIERREEKRRKRGSLSFSEMEQVKEIEEEDEEKIETSSSSEWSDNDAGRDLGKSNRRSHHNTTQCLACCTRMQRSKRQRKISSSSRLRTDTESSYGNHVDGSPISLKWRLRSGASEGGSGESFSCGEADSDIPPVVPPPILSHTRVRRDILKHVGRMCNPVWAKASKQSLLRLRQSHQSVFQDVCLYSSVCSILSSCACRVSARRFIQELFLELTFNQFYEDAETTLAPFGPPSPMPSSGSEPPKSLPPFPDPLPPSIKSSSLTSPTKNLSTVFEHLACGTQSRQSTSQPSSLKDNLPNT